jgi:hypothetical protein
MVVDVEKMSSASLKFIENTIKLKKCWKFKFSVNICVRNLWAKWSQNRIACACLLSQHQRRIICVTMREIFLCSMPSSEAECSSDERINFNSAENLSSPIDNSWRDSERGLLMHNYGTSKSFRFLITIEQSSPPPKPRHSCPMSNWLF